MSEAERIVEALLEADPKDFLDRNVDLSHDAKAVEDAAYRCASAVRHHLRGKSPSRPDWDDAMDYAVDAAFDAVAVEFPSHYTEEKREAFENYLETALRARAGGKPTLMAIAKAAVLHYLRIGAHVSENVDPKDFVMNAQEGDLTFVAMSHFTAMGQPNPQPQPNYYSAEDDWQPEWSAATHLKLSDYLEDGVLDENDLPFGTEVIILVSPDGSPGEQVPVADVAKRFFSVRDQIDTYMSPEERWRPE